MTIEQWMDLAAADVERRGIPEMVPLLRTLAQATRALRDGEFIGSAVGTAAGPAKTTAPILSAAEGEGKTEGRHGADNDR
jgi:hypothetical protein